MDRTRKHRSLSKQCLVVYKHNLDSTADRLLPIMFSWFNGVQWNRLACFSIGQPTDELYHIIKSTDNCLGKIDIMNALFESTSLDYIQGWLKLTVNDPHDSPYEEDDYQGYFIRGDVHEDSVGDERYDYDYSIHDLKRSSLSAREKPPQNTH